MEEKVKITKKLSPPEKAGTYFRILCMTGKHKGVAYFINADRVIIGRSSAADIQIYDDKSSREHGELVKSEGTYILTDIRSSNGIVVNDVKIIQQKLTDGDKIIIGRTVFRFNIIKVRQEHLVKKEILNDKNIDEPERNKKNKKIIIYGSILLALFFVFFEEEPSRKPNAVEDVKSNAFNVNTIGIVEEYGKEQKEGQGSINEEYIHRGQREFREGNYFRAIDEFEMALVLKPGDGNAGFYLNKTKQALNNHIKFMFEKGGREYDQLKYKGAIKSYCEIIKLLQKYPNEERYKNAQKQIKFIGEKTGLAEEEYQCWEEKSGEN